MGYRVVPQELAAAGDAACELAEQGSSIDVAGAVGQAPEALSGARAETKLRELARTMRSKTAELTSDTRTYGNNLSHAAEYYRTHEERASDALDGLSGELGAEADGPR